ncbi:MAG: hypothetical protein M3O80_08610 [Chloroflexota bacterium]|nr:hypothetical protein [Chloroflexota bacterium]
MSECEVLLAGEDTSSRAAGVWRSVDGGRTLTLHSAVPLARVRNVLREQADWWLAGEDALGVPSLLRSSDGGVTWTTWRPPMDRLVDIALSSAGVIAVGAQAGAAAIALFRRDNTWVKASIVEAELADTRMSTLAAAGGVVVVGGVGPDGAVALLSGDGGSSFRVSRPGNQFTSVLASGILSDDVVIGGFSGQRVESGKATSAILRSGTTNWTPLGLPDGIAMTSLSCQRACVAALATGRGDALLRLGATEASWGSVLLPVLARPAVVERIVLTRGNHGYAFGTGGPLLRVGLE